MLMNHHAFDQTVYLRYTVRYVTGESLIVDGGKHLTY